MLISEGDNCLMVDADGATEINCLINILEKMNNIKNDGHGIVAGSRNHIFSKVKRNFIR
jgi:dolichyl-phosphate beta-glucosyltransferase